MTTEFDLVDPKAKSFDDYGFIIPGALYATQLSDDYYDEFKNGLRFTGSFIVLCCQDTSGRYREAEFEKFVYRVLSE